MSNREEVLIIAHRGASADKPENTVDAFVEAGRQGADWVELDVRLTLDGELIVNHDAWYHDERTVWATPSPERPASVPDLATSLDACLDAGASGVNVELKNLPDDLGGDDVPWSLDPADALLDLLSSREAAGIEEQILVSSFDPPTIDRIREMGGPPTGQLLVELPAWPTVIESCVERGHTALHPWDPFVDRPVVEAAQEAGLALNVWTVDDPDRIRRLADMGAHGIITNVPARARAALQNPPDPA